MEKFTISARDERTINAAKKLGIVNEVAVRNLRIRHEFHELRKTKSYSDSIKELSDNYKIGTHAVEIILYQRNKRKKVHGC